MNIFVLDTDPHLCVQYQVNKHVVKMVTETAQLLSSAHHVLDESGCIDNIYKLTHKNHPCSIWTRTSDKNYLWLVEHFKLLLEEYTYRYGKIHKCTEKLQSLSSLPKNIPIGELTNHPQCMPDMYKVEGNVVEAYRKYYMCEKWHIAQWKNREKPDWFRM